MKYLLPFFMCFSFILNKTLDAQRNYCQYSYKPALHIDSIALFENNIEAVSIFQIKKISKGKMDTILVRESSLKDCSTSILKDYYIKKERQKKSKLIHVIEHKYSGFRYKLVHHYNSNNQISRTINKQKKGYYLEDYIAFTKIKYDYNKEGLLVKSRFYLSDYTINNEDNLILIYKY